MSVSRSVLRRRRPADPDEGNSIKPTNLFNSFAPVSSSTMNNSLNETVGIQPLTSKAAIGTSSGLQKTPTQKTPPRTQRSSTALFSPTSSLIFNIGSEYSTVSPKSVKRKLSSPIENVSVVASSTSSSRRSIKSNEPVQPLCIASKRVEDVMSMAKKAGHLNSSRASASKAAVATLTHSTFDDNSITWSLIDHVKLQLNAHMSAHYIPPLPTLELFGLESIRFELYSILRRTMLNAESSSVLMMGPQGCGKSLVLKHVLAQLKCETFSSCNSFVEVHLSGYLHSDELTAVKEIERQLRMDDISSGDGGMASTRAGLTSATSYCAAMDYLRAVLHQTKLLRVPVIFILDDFDQFAQRSKQTILYNLFDLIQDQNVQLSLVCLSTRIDDYNELELRIKSRSSFRRLMFAESLNGSALEQALRHVLTLREPVPLDYRAIFSEHVDRVFKNNPLTRILQRHLDLRKPMPWFYSMMALVVAKLTPLTPFVEAKMFSSACESLCVDQNETALGSCSLIELTLLVAMAHLENREIITYNFSLVFEEYMTTLRSNLSLHMTLYSSAVCLKAFQHLAEIQLVAPIDRSKHSGQAYEFRLMRLTLEPSQIITHVLAADCISWLREWATQY